MKQRSLNRPIRSYDKLVEIGLTSLDVSRLVLLVEDEFNLTFPVHTRQKELFCRYPPVRPINYADADNAKELIQSTL